MDSEKVKKSFPCYKKDTGEVIFDRSKLPTGAIQQNIAEVYRVCKKGKIDAEAFRCSYEEGIHNKDLNLNDPSTFSTSCFENLKKAKQICKCFGRHNPSSIIARGSITYDSGFSLRDKDKSPPEKGAHIDWWIFEEEHPENYFEEWSEENV